MTRDSREMGRLLRWYPRSWRERYGDELIALVEDFYGDDAIPLGDRRAMARAGLVERLRAATWQRREAIRVDPVREGTLRVWWGWVLVVLAGSGFAKYSERWSSSTPAAHRTVANIAVDTMQLGAVVGAMLCVGAAGVSWSSLRRYVQRDGRAPVLRSLAPALVAVVLALASSATVVVIAHHLGTTRRNNSPSDYRWVFLAWTALLSLSALVFTGSVARLARHLEFSPRQVVVLARLARGLTTVMAVIAGTLALWWVEVALYAPRFWASAGWTSSSMVAARPMTWLSVLMASGVVTALRGVVLTRRRPVAG